MKKWLSLVLALLLLAVPMLSVYAEAAQPAYGWEENVFLVYELQLGFAVPEGARAMTEEEIAAGNAPVPGFTLATNPQSVAGITVDEKAISFQVSYQDLSNDAPLLAEYPVKLATDMATLLGIDPATVQMAEQPFCGVASTYLLLATSTGLVAEVNVVPTGVGAYTFLFLYPATEVEAVQAFATAVFAPMMP